ncbi:MAG: hypothetical protein U0797_20440 [Gemmataceae bacterium]
MSAEVNGARWAEAWSFATLDHVRYRARTAEALLRRLNDVRGQAGLGEVALDEKQQSRARRTRSTSRGTPTTRRCRGWASTRRIRRCRGQRRRARRRGAVIAILPDLADAVDGWLATLYHRIPLLSPRLKRVGFGQAQHPTRGWVTVLDASGGR